MAKNSITAQSDEQEYKQVRKDLIFVIITNVVIFAMLIGLYLVNRSSGKVDSFFSHILKF